MAFIDDCECENGRRKGRHVQKKRKYMDQNDTIIPLKTRKRSLFQWKRIFNLRRKI